MNIDAMRRKANEIRKDVITSCVTSGAGHIAPSLSCVDILVALYYSEMHRSEDPKWEKRDRLVFSKAHGCYGLYSILVDIGYLERQEWIDFYHGSSLSGCVERNLDCGIEASCGSLGHGLPLAVGIAFGARLQGASYRTYCIVGDGEMQEGSNWEAIQFAVKHKLSNLTIVVDANGLQAMDFLCDVLSLEDSSAELNAKFSAFGCEVSVCDGHDHGMVVSALRGFTESMGTGKPLVIIARTIKGYGLTCMENVAKFHFRVPTPTDLLEGNRYE